MNRSTGLQKGLTLLLLLAFVGGGGYLYLISRSIRSAQSTMQYLDTHVMQTPEMVEYTKKTDTDRVLIQAIREDNAEEVARFLQPGMTGSTRVGGKSFAILAISKRAEKVLALLISRGLVDVNLRGNLGTTLLMEAMKTGRPGIVEMVLKQGADVNAVDDKGRTALMYAANAWWGDTPVPIPTNQTTMAAFPSQTEERTTWDKATTHRIVLPLLERGARIDVKDKDGTTAMKYAAGYWGGQPALAVLLLERGADPDDTLMQAAGGGNAELIQKLLDKGANVNQRYPGTYPTALAYAKYMVKMYPNENYKRVVQVLLKAGAKD